MRRTINIGDKYGRLTVKCKISTGGKHGVKWICVCDCGNERTLPAVQFTSGKSVSCGCYRDEIRGKSQKTHGMTGSTEHNIWINMRQRCYNPKSTSYKNYGQKGIIVCEEWNTSFEKFFEDMGPRPDGMSLERIDVNGNYCKDNCKWADDSEQGFNKNMYATNTSGRTGVYFMKNNSRWRAGITKDQTIIYLGEYDTFEEAVIVREQAELEYYGFNRK